MSTEKYVKNKEDKMEKRLVKVSGILLVIILVLTSIVGCTPSVKEEEVTAAEGTEDIVSDETEQEEPEQITLRIYAQYSSDDEKQPFDYAVEKMKEIMPNVNLELEIMAQDDNQKIKTYAATGNLPDIFIATTDVIESFKKSDNILMLDEYVKKLNLEERLLPSSLSLLKDNEGHTWAIPNAGQFAALTYYNKEVFAQNGLEPPTTYEELLACVKTFDENGVIPLALFAKEKWPGVQLYDMLVTREEPKGLTKLDNGEGTVSEDAYVNAAAKLVELVNAGLLPNGAFNLGSSEAGALFKEGKAAMYISGAWSMKGLATDMGDNVGILYYPYADAANADAVKWNMSGGGYNSGFGVSPYSEHLDVAAEFACEFALAFAEGRIIKRGDPNPILKDSPAPEAGYLPIQQKYVDDSAHFMTMTAFPWGIKNAEFKACIEDEVNRLLTGEYAVEDFVENVNKQLP